jgi:hypothetical protein
MIETLTDKALTLEISEEGSEVEVRFLGRSTARDPRIFLGPALGKVLESSLATQKPLVLDFRALEFFNSSTITPVVRLLQQVKVHGGRAIIRYRADLNWQRLSFSALRVLESDANAVVLDGGAA